jgi:hypothetical protein
MMSTTEDELLITDMRCALPTDAWSDAEAHIHRRRSEPPPAGKWRIIDYVSQRFSGSCLQTVHPDAATLTIPLRRKGWHAVSIGLAHPWMRRTFVEVRLTGEQDWQVIEGYRPGLDEPMPLYEPSGGSLLHEEPWIFADLTGKDLEVRYPVDYPQGVRVGVGRGSFYSVRATPVRPEDLPTVTSRRHAYMVQALESSSRYPDDPRWINDQWDVVCSNNNCLNHPLTLKALHSTFPYEPWDQEPYYAESYRDDLAGPLEAGRDPVKETIATVHEHGKRFWFAMRPQAWGTAGVLDQATFTPFFAEHPEYRCVEADGGALSKLSVAFPEVRAYLNKHFKEWLQRGADGISVILVRGYPLVRYEEPIAELFRQRYGQDVRTVPDNEARLLAVWAEVVTEWFRELRQLCDEAGPTELSPRRQLSVYSGPSLEWNWQFGFDVATWAREGLVDVIMPYPTGAHHTVQLYGEYYDRPQGWIDMPAYREALQGTGVEIVPSLGSCIDHLIPLAVYRERAHRHYSEGATGLCRWDNGADAALARARLDDPGLQALWVERYMVKQQNWITELQGMDVTSFAPGLAY